MSGYRSRKESRGYAKYLNQLKQTTSASHCEFCLIVRGKEEALKNGQYFVVTANIFPYSLWDEMGVTDHLLIIPKQHTDTLSALPKAAAVEFVDVMSSYEKKGYSVYARAPNNPIKTVVHQHTHLIKANSTPRRLLLYIRKPHYRISI